jgi:hypothetical protein
MTFAMTACEVNARLSSGASKQRLQCAYNPAQQERDD